MNRSEQIDKLAEALAKAQASIPPVNTLSAVIDTKKGGQ